MIDTHCHLDFDAFDNQRDEILERARAAGVHTLVNIGCDLESSLRSVELAEKHEMIFATVGVHPHDAKTLDDATFDKLSELASHPKVKAIGEIGLDFYRDLSPRSVQCKAYIRQLELAVDKKLPVVIHTRDSHKESLEIIKDFAPDLVGGVFHCFQGTVDDAQQVFDLGFIISVGGVITFKNATMTEVAADVPLDKLILETDSPYLTPVPFRGKRNEPSYVRFVYEKLAELKGESIGLIEKEIDRTAKKFYGLVETFGD